MRRKGPILVVDLEALAKCVETQKEEKETKKHAHAPHVQDGRVMRDGSMGERQSRRARRSRQRRRRREKETSRTIARGCRKVESALEQQVNPSGGGTSARIASTMQELQSWRQLQGSREDLHETPGENIYACIDAAVNSDNSKWVQVQCGEKR